MAAAERRDRVGGGRAPGVDVRHVGDGGQVVLKLAQAALIDLAHVEGGAGLPCEVHVQAPAALLQITLFQIYLLDLKP